MAGSSPGQARPWSGVSRTQRRLAESKGRRNFCWSWKESSWSMDTRQWWKLKWWRIPGPRHEAVTWQPSQLQPALALQLVQFVVEKEQRSERPSEPELELLE